MMKVKTLSSINFNVGKLEHIPSESKTIIIKKGRFVLSKKIDNSNESINLEETSHPLYDSEIKFFKRIYCLEYKNQVVYYFYLFGDKKSSNGYHVCFNFWEHQKFLWLQNQHWFQKEENIRYCVNIFFLIIGVCISLYKL